MRSFENREGQKQNSLSIVQRKSSFGGSIPWNPVAEIKIFEYVALIPWLFLFRFRKAGSLEEADGSERGDGGGLVRETFFQRGVFKYRFEMCAMGSNDVWWCWGGWKALLYVRNIRFRGDISSWSHFMPRDAGL